MFVFPTENEFSGFVVVTPQQDYDGIQLFVWACYSETEEDPIASYIDSLKDVARQFAAKRIVFGSSRRWEKKLAPYGFRPLTTYYATDL